MKRSEVVKIIAEIIGEVTYTQIATSRAIRILLALERRGMRPPPYEKIHESGHYKEYIEGWEKDNDGSQVVQGSISKASETR